MEEVEFNRKKDFRIKEKEMLCLKDSPLDLALNRGTRAWFKMKYGF
jgi:hypothetical protein